MFKDIGVNQFESRQLRASQVDPNPTEIYSNACFVKLETVLKGDIPISQVLLFFLNPRVLQKYSSVHGS